MAERLGGGLQKVIGLRLDIIEYLPSDVKYLVDDTKGEIFITNDKAELRIKRYIDAHKDFWVGLGIMASEGSFKDNRVDVANKYLTLLRKVKNVLDAIGVESDRIRLHIVYRSLEKDDETINRKLKKHMKFWENELNVRRATSSVVRRTKVNDSSICHIRAYSTLLISILRNMFKKELNIEI